VKGTPVSAVGGFLFDRAARAAGLRLRLPFPLLPANVRIFWRKEEESEARSPSSSAVGLSKSPHESGAGSRRPPPRACRCCSSRSSSSSAIIPRSQSPAMPRERLWRRRWRRRRRTERDFSAGEANVGGAKEEGDGEPPPPPPPPPPPARERREESLPPLPRPPPRVPRTLRRRAASASSGARASFRPASPKNIADAEEETSADVAKELLSSSLAPSLSWARPSSFSSSFRALLSPKKAFLPSSFLRPPSPPSSSSSSSWS